MKKIISILSVLAFVLGFSSSTYAQAVNAEATIDAALNTTVNQTIAFGTIANNQTTDATVDPKNGDSNVGSGTVTSGKVTVEGSANTTLDVSYTSTDLTNGGNTLTLNEIVYGNDTDDASTSTSLTSAVQQVDTNASGDYYIYLGGTIPSTSINGAQGGTYTGDITLTVAYN